MVCHCVFRYSFSRAQSHLIFIFICSITPKLVFGLWFSFLWQFHSPLSLKLFRSADMATIDADILSNKMFDVEDKSSTLQHTMKQSCSIHYSLNGYTIPMLAHRYITFFYATLRQKLHSTIFLLPFPIIHFSSLVAVHNPSTSSFNSSDAKCVWYFIMSELLEKKSSQLVRLNSWCSWIAIESHSQVNHG